jgi:hypothetical protein
MRVSAEEGRKSWRLCDREKLTLQSTVTQFTFPGRVAGGQVKVSVQVQYRASLALLQHSSSETQQILRLAECGSGP